MKSTFYLILFLLLGTISCKSSKSFVADPAQKPILEQRIQTMVSSLNTGDFDTLTDLYADDFAGLSPAITFTNKSELITSLRENYAKRPTYIETEQLELHAGVVVGYALLNWRIYAEDMDTDERILTFNQPVMQIWHRDTKKGWQLARVLFYQAD